MPASSGCFEIVRRRFQEWFCPEKLMVSYIMRTLKLPLTGSLCHLEEIPLGISEGQLRALMKEYILREHVNPFKEFEAREPITILSANAWPTIHRFVIFQQKLVAVIAEMGICYGKYQKVYELLDRHMVGEFPSMTRESDPAWTYPLYHWDCAEHKCFLVPIYDRVIHLSPLLMNRRYFGDDPDGTWVRLPGKRYATMPIIGAIFARDEADVGLAWLYLNHDVAKRDEAIALLNIPDPFD